LRPFIDEQNQKYKLQTYVVIARDITDEAYIKYIDDLYAEWRKQSAHFEQEDYLIIVLGLNRRIALKLSGGLEARLGINGKNIYARFERDWLPYAWAGDYIQGLKVLISKINEFVVSKEVELQRRKERAQYIRTVVIPWTLGILALLAIAMIAAPLRRKHLILRKELLELLQKTKEKLTVAQKHLNEYYERYKLLFEIDGEVVYKGKTFELYQRTSKLVNRLQLGVQLLKQQYERAEDLLKREWPLGWKKLEQAKAALTTEKVVLTTDELIGKIKLFSTMNFKLEAQISRLMESLEGYFAEAQNALEQIWEAYTQSVPDAAKAKELAQQVDAQLLQLKDAGVALKAYETIRTAIEDKMQLSDQSLKVDPITSREYSLLVQKELQEFSALIAEVLKLHNGAEEQLKKLNSLRERINALRQDGFLLQEDGGPDPLWDRALQGIYEIKALLDDNERQKALELLAQVSELLNFIATKLDETVEAKDKIPIEAKKLLENNERLKELAVQVKPSLEELKAEFQLESFRIESNNIEEAQALIHEADTQIKLALAKASLEKQEYLGAMEILRRVSQAQTNTKELLEALPARLNELKLIREQAKEMWPAIEKKLEEISQFAQANSFAIMPEVDELIAENAVNLKEIYKDMGVKLPDWPVIQRKLEQVKDALELALAQAQDNVANHEKLATLAVELKDKLSITGKFLDEHTEDRAAANDDYQKAYKFYRDIEAGLGQPKSNWAELIKKAIRAIELNELSLRRAKKDIELYEKAMKELKEAEREIAASDRQYNYNYGIHVDLHRAKAALEAALKAMRARNYESAIALADEAEREAEEAARKARRRLEEIEFEMRRKREEEWTRRRVQSWWWGCGGGSGRGGWGKGSSWGGGGWGSSSGGGGWGSSSGGGKW